MGKGEWLGRISGVLACAALIGAAVLTFQSVQGGPADAPPDEKSAVISAGEIGILYPPDRSTLEIDKLAIVVVSPAVRVAMRITLDGKPLEVERMAFSEGLALRGTRLYASTRPVDMARAEIVKDAGGKALWIAAAELTPGEHLIEAEGARVKVFYTGAGGQARDTWPLFHAHGHTKKTVVNACQECHELSKEGATRILGDSRPPAACEKCHSEVDVQLTHRHVLDSVAKCYLCHDPHGGGRAMLLLDEQEKLCTQCHEGGHSKR
jgi:predicted CXXCH cytochrome family protein